MIRDENMLTGKRDRALLVFIIILLTLLVPRCKTPRDIVPNEVIPSERQTEYQQMEFMGFIHFSVNTFTDKEWGFGDKSPDIFFPEAFDANQWARTAKSAGMKELILTAKHHDGFCLWPSQFTEHSIKNSPWKNGKGDMVKEFADACSKYGLTEQMAGRDTMEERTKQGI